MQQKKIFGIIILILLFGSCHVGRFIFWNFADIDDYKKFPSLPIHKGIETFYFKENPQPQTIEQLYQKSKYKDDAKTIEEFLTDHKSTAFLIIRNDTILYENYFNGYDKNSVETSFSMAKSFTSALIGIAISEGYLKSIDQKITDYLPELKNNKGFNNITIRHLLDMRSGIRYNEAYYNPFGDVAKYYYGRNIPKYIKKLKTEEPPDKHFKYVSVNTELLGMILERATQKKISEYLEEKIWKPLLMEGNASWSTDSKKSNTTRTFCCINGLAHDFAKFGRLYLHKGNWNGVQIIPEYWVTRSTTPQYKDNTEYSTQWWLHENNFYAQGFLGQFIYVVPSKNIIFIRHGKRYGDVKWIEFFKELSESL